MHRTHLFALLAAIPLSLATVHCVGDEPSTIGDDDAGGGATDDGGSGTDGATTSNDGGATTDGSIATGDGGVDAGPFDSCVGATNCPNQIPSAGSLELWLRGGFGETCTAHRLTSWHDESGKGRDATPGTNSDGDAGVPPQCNVDTLNGVPVVTFDAPGTAGGDAVDETMNVDLAFLGGGTAYSIFVVAERTTDSIGGLLATDWEKPPAKACTGNATDNEFNFTFGFDENTNGMNALHYTEGCAGQALATDVFTASTPELDELFFSTTAGHSIFVNGSVLTTGGTGNDLSPLQTSPGHGVIGRASINPISTTDPRLHGKIAEIAIFSTLLSTAERQNIENHMKMQWSLTF